MFQCVWPVTKKFWVLTNVLPAPKEHIVLQEIGTGDVGHVQLEQQLQKRDKQVLVPVVSLQPLSNKYNYDPWPARAKAAVEGEFLVSAYDKLGYQEQWKANFLVSDCGK